MITRPESWIPKTNGTPRSRRLRAIVEVCDGELAIYPIAHCDTDERAILDALRFLVEDFGR